MSSETRAALCWAVIPSAGRGQRMDAAVEQLSDLPGGRALSQRISREIASRAIPKQYLPLAGATLIEHALRPFLDHPRIAGIVVVLSQEDERWETLGCSQHPAVLRAPGGKERMHSVLSGLAALSGRAHENDWVLVHDAARPCLARTDVDRLIMVLQHDPVGGLMAVPLSDTLKRADPLRAAVLETIDRRSLWRAQTPQMFRLGVLQRALSQAIESGAHVTDEAAAIEAEGLKPRLVEGSPTNIKVTRPEDLRLAEAILKAGK